MRIPTDKRKAFSWYRAALAKDDPPIIDGEPQCGYFALRLIKGGPLVPASIWLEQHICDDGYLADDERLRCHINGVEKDPYQVWTWLAGKPIPFAKHEELKHRNNFAGWYGYDVPEAKLTESIDWDRLEPPVFITKE